MWLRTLLDELHRAPTRAAAASALFQSLPAPPGGAPALRTMVHGGDSAGYRWLEVCDIRRSKPENLGPTSSAAIWAARFPGGLLIEVDAGRVVPLERPDASLRLSIGEAVSDRSRRVLSERDASRVVVVALPDTRGATAGALTVELGRAAGAADAPLSEFVRWAADVRERLAVAAPWLLSLAGPDDARCVQDVHLPVVGPSMAGPLATLETLARFGDTLLLKGPTGVGKTSIAAWVHARSPVARGPFEVCKLSSIPRNLVAAELYGWKKGAFSGATADRKGWIRLAEGGTLFLDEVGTLDEEGQVALLEVLERAPYRPLGSDAPKIRPNVRLILATNQDLEAAVAKGTLRDDLYFRMAGAPFALPPLRERRDEIPLWVAWFARRRAEELGVAMPTVSSEVMERWTSAVWPGNLRELDQTVRNALHATIARGAREISSADLPEHARPPEDPVRLLRSAAAAFVRAAPRAGFRLEDADVFRAYVAEEAVSTAGSVATAFRLLGSHARVESRNAHGELKKLRHRRAEFEARVRH